ncbi:MAG: fluoride efflux transporter CrcB [Mesorhizobium sp.]|uniref:fluoride efflux transporter CrcB n=1 Tax=Mesorhizobium sp. TaxID=1871066 RepID=UPI000FE99074|nr:fluoride efflux transporter CrcB [Mesorhizobium sp.]RWE57343.1 MAG: fluoride efflux transporter CrcB [Mesorhizobium sp.]RWE66767.1 MAG: fluoride efflux transporter CrcB [Mesorhizobium sp.]TIU22347.1 MAG: fluoride efflux transporter CrcB [Mesorhizobium sp.]TIX06926.1 MAG: fluoride efflux transporter CrcB [Mesorhizobium sp.]
MQDVLQGLAWVAFGSALGGPARYFVSGFVGRHIGETFPWGTMVVNITGAFALGLTSAVAAVEGLFPMPVAWQFAAVGFLGSYTTVSSFSLQTLTLIRGGQIMRAGGNVVLSLALCLSALALGYVSGSAALGVCGP